MKTMITEVLLVMKTIIMMIIIIIDTSSENPWPTTSQYLKQ